MASHDSDSSTQAQLSETVSADTSVDRSADTSTAPATDTDGDEGTATESQVGLTDISYEGHTVPEPPSERVTVETIEHDEFFECSVGDVLWVDETEYVVIDRPMSLLAPSPLLVVGENGEQGELIAGELPNGTADGVTWKANVAGKDQHEISRDDLICSYDQVYKLEQESLEHVHEWAPNTSHRECPACDSGRSGDPIRIERQASKTVELRSCTNTDCKHVYRFVREFPAGVPAEVLLYDSDADSLTFETIEGVFECEEQDDFKFPVETNKGRDDGFYTAQEIAEFVNPKMTNETVTELLSSDEEVSGGEILEAVTFVTEDTFSDDPREVSSVAELYSDYVDNRLIPRTEEITDVLEEASMEAFFRAAMFLRRVIPDKPSYHKNDPEPTGFDIEGEPAVELVAETIASGTIPDRDDLSADVRSALTDAFESELRARDVVSHSVFVELLTDHTTGKIFGVVEQAETRSGKERIRWKDAAGYEKKMRIDFTKIDPKHMDQQQFRWYLERHDLSTIAP